MAVVQTAAYRTLGKVFSNEVKMVKLTYDFAEDGGLAADTHRLAIVDGKKLFLNAAVQVETACGSVGAATVKIGGETADSELFLAAATGAVASLIDDATFKETAGQKAVVGDGDYITLNIETADLNAGKINVFLMYTNAV